jgi:hypothetical protein
MTEVLCGLTRSKSIIIAAESSKSLTENCKIVSSDFLKTPENVDRLLRTLSEDLGAKRQPFSKNAKLILKTFKEKIGDPELKNTAQEVFQDENEVKKIMQAFLVKKGHDSSKGFREFLKKKKSAKQKKDEPLDQVFAQ